MSAFTFAKRKAHAALSQISDAKNFADVASEVILKRHKEIFLLDRYDPYIKTVAQRALQSRIPDLGMIYNGLFIQSCAAFEDFMRDFIEMIGLCSQNKYENYDDLPEPLKTRNVIATGKLLSNYGDKPKGRPIDFNIIIKSIGTCIEGSKSYQLNAEAFSSSIKNCSSEALRNYFSYVGFSGNIWDKVSKRKNIKRIFKSKGTRETRKLLFEKIDEIVGERNKIAHSVGRYLNSGELDIALDLHKSLVDAICEVGDEHIA